MDESNWNSDTEIDTETEVDSETEVESATELESEYEEKDFDVLKKTLTQIDESSKFGQGDLGDEFEIKVEPDSESEIMVKMEPSFEDTDEDNNDSMTMNDLENDCLVKLEIKTECDFYMH